jgi:hypothetical protein
MLSRFTTSALLLIAALLPGELRASSHREAPFLTKNPKVDASDFYLFGSYESGRGEFVTLIANYVPLQDAYGGPSYFTLDPDAIYEIHVDNNGDGSEDLTFQFDFDSALTNSGIGLALSVGSAGMEKSVAVPFANIGAITAADRSAQNVLETYQLKVIRGDRRTGTASEVVNLATGSTTFDKPLDHIGSKSFADYAAYASAHVHDIDIPGCTPPTGTHGRVFVGQRAEGFAANLGPIFDLVNLDATATTPAVDLFGAADQGGNLLAGKNVTSLAIEVPAACLVGVDSTIIGGWTTASVRQARVINPGASFEQPAREGGPWAQVSRLGMPLVNEVVIGLKDKDLFNASEPSGDAQFGDYITHPTLPEIMEILFGAAGVQAPNNFPRADLIAVFLTGVAGVNATASSAEMLRLNTAVSVTALAGQQSLGAALCFDRDPGGSILDTSNLGCDVSGFPNGRRPGDDVVDIALRVVMGFLAPTADSPSGELPFTDGAYLAPTSFPSAFPYLNPPRPGAP